MNSIRPLAAILVALTFVGCSRDPNVAKKRYLENGNKYFAKGKYKEASIMYRNALQKDQRYGMAYYRLALTDLRLGRVPNSLGEFRRAMELIPKGQPEHLDSQIRLAEIYIAFTRESRYLDEVDGITKELLQGDPNSYDGHRLTADLDFVKAQISVREQNPEKAKAMLEQAIDEYRKAMSIKAPNKNLKLQLARALAADRQYPEAEQLYKQCIQEDKSFTNAYTELYNTYLFQSKVSDAEQVLKEGAANNPKQVNYLVMLAGYYSAYKRRDDMVRVLNQIKSRAKDFDRAYTMVGDFYLRNGDADEALRQYKEGMAADPHQKATYQKRMIEVLMRQGKRTMAADINDAILKENPKDSDARGLQATLLLDKGDVQKAVSELQAVVSAAPDNFVARYNLGRAHLARREWEQARQQFSEAVRERPDYLPARIALAQLQVAQNEFDAALKSVGAILQIDRNNGPAHLVEAAALLGEKKYTESKELLLAMEKANPNAPEIAFSLGMVALSEGNYKEAEDIFRKSYAADPKDTRPLVGLVETLSKQDKYDQAVEFLQGELVKTPDRTDLHMALGTLAVHAGNFDLALKEYQIVLNTFAKDGRTRGELYLRIGEVLRRKGDMTGSVAALEKAHDALPDNSIAASTLALSLESNGRRKEAIQVYEQAIKLDPRNGIALNNLAFAIAETGGDLDQALTYAQRAKQILPNLNEVSDTLGWIYLKKNLSDNAMDIFHDLVVKAPNNSTFRYHLGMAQAEKGDKPSAIKELEQALRSSPTHDEEGKIRDLIAKLQQ